MLSSEWKYFISLFEGQRFKLLLSVIASIAQSLMVIPIVFIVKRIFDDFIPNENYDSLLWMGAALFLLNLVSYGINLWSVGKTLEATKTVITLLRVKLLDKCFALSRQFYTNSDLSKLQARLIQDTHRLDVMSNALISNLVPQSVIAASLSIVLLFLNWKLFLTLAVIFPLLFLLKQVMKGKRTERIKKYHRSVEDYSQSTLHLLQKMDLIRVQSAEQFEAIEQNKKISNVKQKSFSMALFNTAYKGMQTGITAQVGILMLVVGGIAVGKATMTLGALLSFYVAAAKMSTAMTSIFAAVPALTEGNESLISLVRFIEFDEEPISTGTEAVTFTEELSIDSVSFGYGDKPVLSEVNLSVSVGETTTIVGPNGAGKSTLINLILGLYKPQKGELKIDGNPYSNLDLNLWRTQVGVVLQDHQFFNGTIRENIVYGNLLNTSIDEVEKVCELSGASDFIQGLEYGLDSELGDNGVLLSGGQRQKIAIARALYKKPKLLILDEPTNHLDPDSVGHLMNTIKNLESTPAVLMITQDQSVTKFADKLVEITLEGKLVEHAHVA